jgi:hypothetical protein
VLSRSCSLSTIAGAILLAWLGAVHHDIWFELAEVAHEHSNPHHEPHDDGNEGDREDGDTPLTLPNIHSTPFVVSGVTSSGTIASPIGEFLGVAPKWTDNLNLRGVDCANAPPPDWVLVTGIDAATLLLIAHCVQSNAPPSMV